MLLFSKLEGSIFFYLQNYKKQSTKQCVIITVFSPFTRKEEQQNLCESRAGYALRNINYQTETSQDILFIYGMLSPWHPDELITPYLAVQRVAAAILKTCAYVVSCVEMVRLPTHCSMGGDACDMNTYRNNGLTVELKKYVGPASLGWKVLIDLFVNETQQR